MASSQEQETLGTAGYVWEPLSLVDFGVVGFVATLQVLALWVCGHLIWWRRWPPYVTKNANLVVISTLSGVLWTFTMAIACGYLRRRTGDILAACDFERFLSWSPLCVNTLAFFIRVYRMWRILIKHDATMWQPEYQLLLMSTLSFIPVVSTWVIPRTGVFDEVANTCHTTVVSSYITLSMNALGFLVIFLVWIVCARQLKCVRRQFNEYESMKQTLLLITLTLMSYPLVVLFLLQNDVVTQRRVALLYPLVTTHVILWGTMQEPLIMKLHGDREYLLSYTKGFSEMPSPAQLKASLAEQLSVDQLRSEFRRYIKTKVAVELVDFYLDSLDREEVVDFFERQAMTMRIVDKYIKEGAPDQVNISEECREKVLATHVTAYEIFDDARAEVLAVMETNFRGDFLSTEGFRRIANASEEEQREIGLLRAGGMLPSSPLATRPRRSTSPQEGNDLSSLPLTRRLVAMVKALPPFLREVVTVSTAPRTKVPHDGRIGLEHRRRASEDSLEMSETCMENPMVAFTCSTSTVQSTNGVPDGASSMGHRSRISEDSLETSDIFIDNPMVASACSVVRTQSSPAATRGATLPSSVDNGRPRMAGSDPWLSMVKSPGNSSDGAAQSWNVAHRIDNRSGGDKAFYSDYDERNSLGGSLPVTTVWPRPSHHPKEGANVHMSRSDSFARATESGLRSSTTSSKASADRTSTDSLRGLYIASRREITSKGYKCRSMSSSEQSVGLDTRSGEVVELTNARPPHPPRGSPILLRNGNPTNQAHRSISNSGISSASLADQRKPDQAEMSLNCDGAFLEKSKTADRSLAELQDHSRVQGGGTAAATSPPGLDRLKKCSETTCEGTPSRALFVDVNIED